MWDVCLRMLVEIVVLVICSQVLLALVGNSSFTKYLRMFVGMLVLFEFCMAVSGVLLALEDSVRTLFGIGG